jgi:uncharacterized UBP type Zn finger protein
MGEKNNLFFGYKAGDAKDLFFNLIDSLVYELKSEKNDEISEINNVNNQQQMFYETKKETDSNIINDLFVGYYETVYTCKENNNIMNYSFGTESFILINLEKLLYFYHKNVFTIEMCLAYNFTREYNTEFFCSNCKKIEKNCAKEFIYEPPKILVLILDRGHGKKFIGLVKFEKELDIKYYIDSQNNQYNTKYDLIGIINHLGKSSSSGHYTACCLTDNEKYYYFSDINVTQVNEPYFEDHEPYLLFYRRKDNNN